MSKKLKSTVLGAMALAVAFGSATTGAQAHHKKFKHGFGLSFGTPVYDCDYFYWKWQSTGKFKWKYRYFTCIGAW